MGKKPASRSGRNRPALEQAPAVGEEGDSKFARALGSGDYHTREHGVQALSLWLQSQKLATHDSLLKIWKGIFFCFWHSDKAHVQEDLAKRLATLLMDLNLQLAVLYYSAFLHTMRREWARIDRLRLDKFMMMSRCFLFHAFSRMAASEWNADVVRAFSQAVQDAAFEDDVPGAPVGFSLHVTDVYVDELCKAAEDCGVPTRLPWEALLQPFVHVASRSHSKALLARVRTRVFNSLAERAGASKSGAPAAALLPGPELADALHAAGSAADLRPRNRAVLYDASAALEARAAETKRRRDDGDAPGPRKAPRVRERSTNGLAARTGMAVAAPNGTSDAARDVGCDGARPLDSRTANGEAHEGTEAEPAHVNPDTQGARRHAPAHAQPLARAALCESADGKHRVGGAAIRAADVQDASPDPADDALAHQRTNESNKKAKKKKKKKKRKEEQRRDAAQTELQADVRGGNRSNGIGADTSKPAEMRQHDADGAARQALAGAVRKLDSVPGAKRLKFNLKRNVVMHIGGKLPPAEMRTPPSARPCGSALKGGSSTSKASPARARAVDFF